MTSQRKFTRAASCLLALLLLSACGGGQQPAPAQTPAPQTPAPQTQAPQTQAPQSQAPAATPEASAPAQREVTDMAGRKVTIPTAIDKVMGCNAMAQSMMYTLAPEKLGSVGSELRDGEEYFYTDYVKNLPVLGDNSGKRTMNPEEVVKAAPDIILHVTAINENAGITADEAQALLNIPVVVVDSNMDTIDDACRFLGDVLGMQERADEYADCARRVMDDVSQRAAAIPEEERVRIYYAEGEEGLQTDPEGSDHARAFTKVRAINVAEVGEYDKSYGRAQVSMEHVLAWDPEVIVFCPDSSIFDANSPSICQDLMDGKAVNAWQSVPAVQAGKVYEAPYGIANAIDRPASVNLLYGYQWLGNLLYPKYFDYDMTQVTKEFYSMFYHYDMNDEEVARLLSRSTMKE